MRERRIYEKVATEKMQRQAGFLATNLDPAANPKINGGKIMRIISKGFIFRWGMRIKDFGERVGHVKIRRVFVFGWLADLIVPIGLAIKNSVLGCPLSEM